MPGQTKAKRVFPVEMLFMRTTVLLFVEICTAGALIFTTLYYIPLYFQFTKVRSVFYFLTAGRQRIKCSSPSPAKYLHDRLRLYLGRRPHRKIRLLLPLLHLRLSNRPN